MSRKKKFPDRYIYPAILVYEAEGGISVLFPDLPGCQTCGDTQEEALAMAQDALKGHLSCLEDFGDPIPAPSDLRNIHLETDQSLIAVEAWMVPLRQKTVRKNLTIPAYLADAAERQGVNFSQVLSDALQNKLKVSYPTKASSVV